MKDAFFRKVKSLDLDMVSIGRGYLSGILGALTVFAIVHACEVKLYKIGTVNITALVDQFEKQEANKQLTHEAMKRDVTAFGGQLETELNKVSKKYHLILLPSEAVISGSMDYTSLVRGQLANKMKSEDA